MGPQAVCRKQVYLGVAKVADQPVRANRSVHSLAVHLEMKGKALCRRPWSKRQRQSLMPPMGFFFLRLDLLGSDLPMPGSEARTSFPIQTSPGG